MLKFGSLEPTAPSAATQLDDIEQLVLTHRSRLLRSISFAIGDPDLAETIVQDCFLKAYISRASFRGDCNVQTWLNRIALNLVRDHQRALKVQFWRRAAKNAVDVSAATIVLPSNQPSPERRLLAREEAARVMTEVELLSFTQRTIFLLRFQEEMELMEISAVMNMPINTVKSYLHRAVRAIRESMG